MTPKEEIFVALLTILEFPAPRLRLRAAPVSHVSSEVTALGEAMLEPWYQAPGIGLAQSSPLAGDVRNRGRLEA